MSTVQYICTFTKACLNEGFLGELLVDFWSIGDVLSPVSIIQSGESLFQVTLSWRDSGYDRRLGTATE